MDDRVSNYKTAPKYGMADSDCHPWKAWSHSWCMPDSVEWGSPTTRQPNWPLSRSHASRGKLGPNGFCVSSAAWRVLRLTGARTYTVASMAREQKSAAPRNNIFIEFCRLRSEGPPMCRPGCRRTETTAHILQSCDRTGMGGLRGMTLWYNVWPTIESKKGCYWKVFEK